VPIPAMDIPGHPPNQVTAVTTSGELYGSAAGHIVHGTLAASAGPGITFAPGTMWHSDVAPAGEVEVELTFPVAVTLSAIGVHSQHSGAYHAAVAVRIEARPPDSDYVPVTARPVAVDDVVTFAATSAQHWRLSFAAGASGMVVIRALQFFDDGAEVFPPFVSAP